MRDRVGKNEKTKVVAKLQKPGHGAPAREPCVSEGERKAMMAHYFKRQEELKALAEADDDDYLHSAWADTKALKNSLQGISGACGRRGSARVVRVVAAMAGGFVLLGCARILKPRVKNRVSYRLLAKHHRLSRCVYAAGEKLTRAAEPQSEIIDWCDALDQKNARPGASKTAAVTIEQFTSQHHLLRATPYTSHSNDKKWPPAPRD